MTMKSAKGLVLTTTFLAVVIFLLVVAVIIFLLWQSLIASSGKPVSGFTFTLFDFLAGLVP